MALPSIFVAVRTRLARCLASSSKPVVGQLAFLVVSSVGLGLAGFAACKALGLPWCQVAPVAAGVCPLTPHRGSSSVDTLLL